MGKLSLSLHEIGTGFLVIGPEGMDQAQWYPDLPAAEKQFRVFTDQVFLEAKASHQERVRPSDPQKK